MDHPSRVSLFDAIEFDDLPAVVRLVEADPTVLNREEDSGSGLLPLAHAVDLQCDSASNSSTYTVNIAVISYLIDAGADPHRGGRDSALDIANQYGRAPSLQQRVAPIIELLRGPDV